jgi:two-component system sensor histidine kinase UhpB
MPRSNRIDPALEPGADVADRLARLEQDREALARDLHQGEKRLRGLARAAWKVEEQERARLARELHDGIGQTLTALAMRLERLAAEAAAEAGLGALDEALGLARQALAETRELAHLLRPPILDDLGLVPALRWLARTFGRHAGIAVDVAEEGLGSERLPADVETLLFRVAQEALTNVAKHAAADCAHLRLARRGEWIALSVVDRGRGFDVGAAPQGQAAGFGLKGMRDRVECSDGLFSLRSAPGAGTRLEVTLPLAGGGPP